MYNRTAIRAIKSDYRGAPTTTTRSQHASAFALPIIGDGISLTRPAAPSLPLSHSKFTTAPNKPSCVGCHSRTVCPIDFKILTTLSYRNIHVCNHLSKQMTVSIVKPLQRRNVRSTCSMIACPSPQRPLAIRSTRRVAHSKAENRRQTRLCTKRHVTCCSGTGQSAERFYEFLLEQQASIIQVSVQAYTRECCKLSKPVT